VLLEEIMNIHIVVRKGVYDHGVVAVVNSLEEAKQAAETWAAKENDAYHDFVVRTVDSDGEYDKDVATFCTSFHEGTVIRVSDKRFWK
jgi:hypothetical protein